MPNLFVAFVLFLSSYTPALLILAIRAAGQSWWMFGACVIGIAVTAVAFAGFTAGLDEEQGVMVEIDSVEPRDSELAAYMATYLLPFVTVSDASAQDVAALGLFVVFMGVIWINSGLIYLNPLLQLVGRHVYVVTSHTVGTEKPDSLAPTFLIAKRSSLQVGDRLTVARLRKSTALKSVPSRHERLHPAVPRRRASRPRRR